MSTLSAVGSASGGWSGVNAMRSQMQAKMFAKADADGSGSVDKTELQGLLDDVAKKSGTTTSSATRNVDELLKKMDADSSGSLSQDELEQGLKEILPPPPSGAGAAHGAGASGSDDLFSKIDSDGDGAVSKAELQSLMDKMSAGKEADSTSSAQDTETASSELFAKLDTNGDDSLSQDEFDAGKPQGAEAAGGRPPPPAGGPPPGGGGGGAVSSSTTYDPLDTNEDGIVSVQERLAGSAASASTDAVQALFAAVDTDSDNSISASESDAFIQQLTSQLSALDLARQAADTQTASNSAASQQEKSRFDLSKLARNAYENMANSLTQQAGRSALSLTA